MSTILNDLDLLVQDYIGNYSTGTLKQDVRYRAINRAIEYCRRLLGIPADEDIHTFWYTEDQFFYDLPSSFREALFVQYNNKLSNTLDNKWDYFDYPHVLQGLGGVRQNRWSVTHINGKKQLVMAGYNGIQGRTLLTMDSTTNWTASDDASGLTTDTNVKYEGAASLSFDITNSAGVATLTRTGLNLDLKELFERNGFLKFLVYMTDKTIDSIAIKLQSSSGNYYTLTATIADDGTAFAEDVWQKIGFHTINAVQTGTVDLTKITQVSIEFDLGSSFVSAADFRIDKLFAAYPEKMDLVHLINTKGTDATGVTSKSELSVDTDILYYSGDYDEYTDLIAQRAALVLWPQLRGDKEAMLILKQEFNTNLKSFARAFPRKRVQGQYRHNLRR